MSQRPLRASTRDLEDLLKRVRTAKGPDRSIDLAICNLFRQPMRWSGDATGLGSPHYTSSIDACIALIEEVMTVEWPAFEVHARMVRDRDRWWNYIEITVPSSEFQGHSNHAPLALLEALLCAQIHMAANTRKPVGGEK